MNAMLKKFEDRGSRLEELQSFAETVKTSDFDNDETFVNVLQTARLILEIGESDIADDLLVSRPTVNRWLNGKNLPRRGVRASVKRWIQRSLGTKTGLLRSEARPRERAAVHV